MKTILALSLATTLGALVNAGAIEPDSKIDAVSLFQDAALVTRVATFDAQMGKSMVNFSDLPSTADSTSLQAAIISDSNGVIRNAKLYLPEDAEPPTEIEVSRERIQELKKEIGTINSRKTIASQEYAFGRQLSSSFSKQFGEISDGQSLSLDQAKQALAYATQTMSDANAKIATADTEIEAINEQIKEIEKELKQALESHAKLRSVAVVEIEMAVSGQVQLEVSYLIRNANWQPRYELRAHPDQKALDFGYFATIYQDTGEDWTDVTLSLQTNQANRNGNVPELYPLRINKSNGRVYGRQVDTFELSPFSVDSSASRNTKKSNVSAVPPPAQAQISSSTTAFQIELPGKASIPSASESTTLPITEKRFDTAFWSEVVPPVRLESFLIGKTTNTLDLPILPGQALAFVDGKLSSKVYLQKILPEEELKLSLGVDANIVVKRREGASKDASTGFIDKTTTLKREYFNEVSNYHTVAHKVVIADLFPISQNSKIEVRRLSPNEDAVNFDEDDANTGIFEWTATLNAKESKTFTTSYEIIYPRDWSIYPDL